MQRLTGIQQVVRPSGHRLRYALLALVGLAAAITLTACGSSSGSTSANSSAAPASSASANASSTTIRVALPSTSTAHLPIWVAQEKGFFAKRGLKVQLSVPNIPFSSQLAALGHEYDLIVATQPDLINAVASGVNDVALFGEEIDVPQNPAAALVMSQKSGVTSIGQMAGHSVAAPSLTGNNWAAFECWLNKSGVKPSSVRGVAVTTPEVPDVLHAGRVEGALIFNPFLATLTSEGYKLIGDPYKGCFGPGEQNGYYTATRAWATDHEVALAKFLAAEKEALAYIISHKAEARTIYDKASGLPKSVASHAIIYPPEMNFSISVSDFAKWEHVLKTLGKLPGSAPSPDRFVMKLPSAS